MCSATDGPDRNEEVQQIPDFVGYWNWRIAKSGEPGLHPIEMEAIEITKGAIAKAARYVAKRRCNKVSVVVDDTTYSVAGEILCKELENKGMDARLTVILPDRRGDVVADEVSVIQVLLDIQQHGAEMVFAAGGGTIHDIVRYAAYTAHIPFVSIPTAPSVDGFTSKGAPIIVRGEKITIPAVAPVALFADLDILVHAPQALVAAGFGDMIGKHTALFDWRFGHLIAGEPYSPLVAEMTREALQQCEQAVSGIAERSEAGIRTLMQALIQSGLAMLVFGQSHPASGAEHHLSHYWEMEYLRTGKKQLLHGAKVGAATVEIARLYKRIREAGEWVELCRTDEEAVKWDEVLQQIEALPDEAKIARLLHQVGCPASVGELPVSDELVRRSLLEAHHVRQNRHTLLRACNERRESV